MTRKHATLSLAAAMLIFSSGTVFAQDDRQQARGQRGGLAGAVPGGNSQRALDPVLPAEPSIPLPETLPVVAPSQQAAPDRTASPSLPPELPVTDLPSLDDSSMPELPALGDDQFAPIVDEPRQTDQHVTISQEPSEKKPGFFKRMWTKVKGFVSGVSNKVKTMIANNRAKRAEKKALEANSQSAQVLDANIYQGGGDGGASGSAAE
jgi:hypothetical protein